MSSPKAHCVPGALCLFQPTNGVSAQRFSVQPESHRGVITHQGLLSESSKVGAPVIPILQKRRLRLGLAQGHTAGGWERQDSKLAARLRSLYSTLPGYAWAGG